MTRFGARPAIEVSPLHVNGWIGVEETGSSDPADSTERNLAPPADKGGRSSQDQFSHCHPP